MQVWPIPFADFSAASWMASASVGRMLLAVVSCYVMNTRCQWWATPLESLFSCWFLVGPTLSRRPYNVCEAVAALLASIWTMLRIPSLRAHKLKSVGRLNQTLAYLERSPVAPYLELRSSSWPTWSAWEIPSLATDVWLPVVWGFVDSTEPAWRNVLCFAWQNRHRFRDGHVAARWPTPRQL